MAKDEGGYVDYPKLVADEFGVPESEVGVVHGNNLLIFCIPFPWDTRDLRMQLTDRVKGIQGPVLVRFI